MQSKLPMHLAPRCLARTRKGPPCQAPNVKGKKRCRMHGGAKGSGAPTGERNGNYRHGHYTKAAKANRRHMEKLIRSSRELMDSL